MVVSDAGDAPEPAVVWSYRWRPIDGDPARSAGRQGAIVSPVERRVDRGVESSGAIREARDLLCHRAWRPRRGHGEFGRGIEVQRSPRGGPDSLQNSRRSNACVDGPDSARLVRPERPDVGAGREHVGIAHRKRVGAVEQPLDPGAAQRRWLASPGGNDRTPVPDRPGWERNPAPELGATVSAGRSSTDLSWTSSPAPVRRLKVLDTPIGPWPRRGVPSALQAQPFRCRGRRVSLASVVKGWRWAGTRGDGPTDTVRMRRPRAGIPQQNVAPKAETADHQRDRSEDRATYADRGALLEVSGESRRLSTRFTVR